MQAEIDGEFALVPFNTGGSTHIEMLKNKIIEWCSNEHRCSYGYSTFFNIGNDYDSGITAYITDTDSFNFEVILLVGDQSDGVIERCVDKIRFNEEKIVLKRKILIQ